MKELRASSFDPKFLKMLVMDCTFFNQSFMSFMMLILEDRAVYNIEQLKHMIKASNLAKNEQVAMFMRMLLRNSRNPAKRGVIGKYQDKRSKMLTPEEMCVLADVCEEYDKTIQIQNRILFKRAKEHIMREYDLPEETINILTKIITCIVCCDMVEMYYKAYREKPDYIQIKFRGHPISADPFTAAIAFLDNMAFAISGQKFSFKDDAQFDKAYIAYIKTIVNNDRLMEHYNRIGIKDSVKIKVDGHPELDLVVMYQNNNNKLLTSKN